jgi:hypothetical protein
MMQDSFLTVRTLAAVGPEELAERGTPEFYRDQAIRLALAAIEVTDPAIRVHLLEMASAFRDLAKRAASVASNSNIKPAGERTQESA